VPWFFNEILDTAGVMLKMTGLGSKPAAEVQGAKMMKPKSDYCFKFLYIYIIYFEGAGIAQSV
jgi:hypothetical protein